MSDDNTKEVAKAGLSGVTGMALGGLLLGPVGLASGFIFGVAKMVGAGVAGKEGAKAVGTFQTLTDVASGGEPPNSGLFRMLVYSF